MSLRVLRQKPLIKYLFFGAFFLIIVYGLFQFGPRYYQATPLSTDIYHSSLDGVPAEVWMERREQVKLSFQHAYHGYEQYAAPSDELLPLSKYAINQFNRWGLTVFDSLDTMILMGLNEEYQRALLHVQKTDFSLPPQYYAPYFETVIRYLGGLLSAYALTDNPMLLHKADELAQKLDPVFETKSGFPWFGVNPSTGKQKGVPFGSLAEIGSLQLEYLYLAKASGNKTHFDRVNTVMKNFEKADLTRSGGMLPLVWDLVDGAPYDDSISVGARGDSAHEYLLKQYLLTSKRDKKSLELYIQATTVTISTLLYLSPTRNLLYVTDRNASTYPTEPSNIFEHLSCFLPGLLVLGAHTLPLDNLESLGINLVDLAKKGGYGEFSKGYEILSTYNLTQVHLWAAEGIAQTCWLTYADQPTGLGPDEVRMDSGGMLWIEALERWRKSGARGPPPGVADKEPMIYSEAERLQPTSVRRRRDYAVKKRGYLLRPETLESFYLMWRFTGQPKWRNYGWAAYQAIEKHTRTAVGYASVLNVEVVPPPQDDIMPSYFLAETLKYLYFLFSEKEVISLDKWVLNTEAHPLPIFEWTEKDRQMYDIRY